MRSALLLVASGIQFLDFSGVLPPLCANHSGLHVPRAAASWPSCLFVVDEINYDMGNNLSQHELRCFLLLR